MRNVGLIISRRAAARGFSGGFTQAVEQREQGEGQQGAGYRGDEHARFQVRLRPGQPPIIASQAKRSRRRWSTAIAVKIAPAVSENVF